MTAFPRRSTCAVALALACVLTGRAQEGRVEKLILVTVLDAAGAPLRDLEPAEFIVNEDNARRRVTGARLATDPLYVSVLVDTSKPMPGVPFPTQDLRRALSGFVAVVLGGSPETEVELVDIAGAAVTTVPSTAVAADLERGIGRLVPSQRSSAVLLEGLIDAGRSMSQKPSPRRAIVSVTIDSPEASTVHPRVVADAVQQSGAAYWPISIRGAGNPLAKQAGMNAEDNTMVPTREVLFESLPALTGGRRLTALSTTALEPLLAQVAAALTSQYEVTYERPAGTSVKTIKVSAKRGVTVLRASMMR